MKKSTFILVLLAAMGVVGAAMAAEFFTGVSYVLSTEFRGRDKCLDVHEHGPKRNLTRLGNCATQGARAWNLVEERDGLYRLTTEVNGAEKCLDVVNGGEFNNHLTLAECGNYSGQYWDIYPVDGRSGFYRLSSTFRDSRCADVVNGGPDNNDVTYEHCQNVTGQFWRLADPHDW